MGGIGEVSTKAAYRRQGLSGKLLEMSVAYMEAEDLDFSMLGTGTPGTIVAMDGKRCPPTGSELRFIQLGARR